jgi:hypothetical protein
MLIRHDRSLAMVDNVNLVPKVDNVNLDGRMA